MFLTVRNIFITSFGSTAINASRQEAFPSWHPPPGYLAFSGFCFAVFPAIEWHILNVFSIRSYHWREWVIAFNNATVEYSAWCIAWYIAFTFFSILYHLPVYNRNNDSVNVICHSLSSSVYTKIWLGILCTLFYFTSKTPWDRYYLYLCYPEKRTKDRAGPLGHVAILL